MSLLDDLFDEEDYTGKIRRTKNGRPYVLYNPDWEYGGIPESVNRVAGEFSQKPAESRGLSKLYTRTTTFVSCLEDTYSLGQWQERMTVLGLAKSPQLVAEAQRVDTSNPDRMRDALNEVARKAKDVANWHEKADLGTDFHEIAREFDGGRTDWPMLSDASVKMLRAYEKATQGWEYAHIEEGMVNDELGYYGTPDRLRLLNTAENNDHVSALGWSPEMGKPRQYLRVTDIKTGRIDYGQSKMALQMAAYALSSLYDPDTGIRTELDIDTEYAEIIHVPYGEGTCTVYPVPLAPAIEALTELVPRVRAFRAKQTWFDAPQSSELTSGLAASWPAESPEAL